MSELFRAGFRLGDCLVDPARGRVRRPDGIDHVTPKAMEILLCLVARPGVLIDREQLIEAGWGGGTNHEEALTRCIAELRHALDDHHDDPKYIHTIPRRGYRLVADVHILESNPTAGAMALPAQDNGDQNPSLWAELMRRDVVRSSLAYAAGAWLLIEVFSVVGSIFDWPTWLLRVLVIMAVIGFPIVIALSWVVQKTPSGLALDMPVLEDGPPVNSQIGRKVDLAIIVTLLIAISFLLYREFSGHEPPDLQDLSAYQDNSVAVLAFENLSSNTNDDYIGDGLAEELLNLLAQAKDLSVASRTASFYYKNKDIPLPAIISALRVRNIVEGSVQRAGDRLRVTVQLIDGKTLMHTWSESYDTSLEDLLDIRDTVARQVATELETVITDRGERVMTRTQAVNRSAYLLYLQARAEMRKEHSDATLDSAEVFLEQAISSDSRFAKAYAGLCDVNLARYLRLDRDQTFFEKAEKACHRAITLDADLGEVYVALGNLYRESGQPEKALLDIGRALEVDPTSHEAIFALAKTLEDQGDLDAAEFEYRRLIALQPGYWHSYNALGHFLYGISRYTEAVTLFERVTTLTPDNALGFNNLGAAQYMLGNYTAAVESWEASMQLRPSHLVLSNIGLAAYYAGQFERATEMQQEAIKEAPKDFRMWGRLGDAQRQLLDASAANIAYAEAIRFAGHALELNPKDEETLRYLSLYYSHIGDDENAIQTIEKVRDISPESPRVHYFASKVYFGAGDFERAVLELEKALALGYSLEIAAADPDLEALRETGRFPILTSGGEDSEQL